jgi:hypothetical protein
MSEATFLDHGLFEFWKRLEGHALILLQRQKSRQMRARTSKFRSVEAFDLQNFIGQVHHIMFYIGMAKLTAICIAIFLLEISTEKARELSLFVLTKFTHFSLQLWWAIVRFLYLMSRLIGNMYKSRNPS